MKRKMGGARCRHGSSLWFHHQLGKVWSGEGTSQEKDASLLQQAQLSGTVATAAADAAARAGKVGFEAAAAAAADMVANSLAGVRAAVLNRTSHHGCRHLFVHLAGR